MRAVASKRSKAANNGLDLREPIETIREDLGQLGTDVADAGKRVVRGGARVLTDSAHKVGEKAKGAQQALYQFTANRPGTSLLVAMGVGAVIGLMIFRRR